MGNDSWIIGALRRRRVQGLHLGRLLSQVSEHGDHVLIPLRDERRHDGGEVGRQLQHRLRAHRKEVRFQGLRPHGRGLGIRVGAWTQKPVAGLDSSRVPCQLERGQRAEQGLQLQDWQMEAGRCICAFASIGSTNAYLCEDLGLQGVPRLRQTKSVASYSMAAQSRMRTWGTTRSL